MSSTILNFSTHIAYPSYYAFPLLREGAFFTVENGDLVSGFMAAIALVCIFIGSREYIRRNFFEVFYISHIFGILLFIAAGFTHQYAVIIFLAPSVFLYFSDRIIRAVRTWASPTRIVDVTLPNQQDITQIVFAKDGHYAKPHPGQFVFVSLNNGTRISRFVNFFNWHPFTLSELSVHDVKEEQSSTHGNSTHGNDMEIMSATKERNSDVESNLGKGRPKAVKKVHGPLQASVHIKGLGNMTHRIHRQAINEPQRLRMKVDGPYGSTATALEMNQVVTFFEAGIGITPSLSMFRDLVDKCVRDPLMVHTTHIYFIWVTNSMGKQMEFL